MSGKGEAGTDDLTTITVPVVLRDELEALKLHRREPLYEVIGRLLQMHPCPHGREQA